MKNYILINNKKNNNETISKQYRLVKMKNKYLPFADRKNTLPKENFRDL